MSQLEDLKFLCGILNDNMVIIILWILFYILGVILSYTFTILYAYYIDNPYSNKENKLTYAKRTTLEYFTEVPFFLSWLFFIIFLIYVVIKILKYLVDKLINFILL